MKNINQYYKIEQLPGIPAQRYLILARFLAKFITPIAVSAICLVLQPFSPTISDWMIEFGWETLVGFFLLMLLPDWLARIRRAKEIRHGYSTWDDEILIDNAAGHRLILVDFQTGLILRVAGQPRRVPERPLESHRERVNRLAKNALQVSLSYEHSHKGSPRVTMSRPTPLRKPMGKTVDEIMAEISPVD